MTGIFVSPNRAGMSVVAALAAAAAFGAGALATARRLPTVPIRARGMGASPWGYQTGPGWTAAHVKPMAQKRRNQQRHKAARRKKCRKG